MTTNHFPDIIRTHPLDDPDIKIALGGCQSRRCDVAVDTPYFERKYHIVDQENILILR